MKTAELHTQLTQGRGPLDQVWDELLRELEGYIPLEVVRIRRRWPTAKYSATALGLAAEALRIAFEGWHCRNPFVTLGQLADGRWGVVFSRPAYQAAIDAGRLRVFISVVEMHREYCDNVTPDAFWASVHHLSGRVQVWRTKDVLGTASFHRLPEPLVNAQL